MARYYFAEAFLINRILLRGGGASCDQSQPVLVP
jgi:hypothetical protein